MPDRVPASAVCWRKGGTPTFGEGRGAYQNHHRRLWACHPIRDFALDYRHSRQFHKVYRVGDPLDEASSVSRHFNSIGQLAALNSCQLS